MSLTCSLMLLIPSGPSRLTACFTRSVRPQLSIRKPRSCRNFASVEAASSFLEAQKQSSVLKGKARKVVHSTSWLFWMFLQCTTFSLNTWQALFSNNETKEDECMRNMHLFYFIICLRVTSHVCACWCFCMCRRSGCVHTHALQPQGRAVPELAGLTVHSGQQQSGSLPNIIAIHREAASVFCVNHGHTHPLHQRRQHHERPVGGDKGTCSHNQRHIKKSHST